MVAPTREFTVSSLLTIGASTLVFGLALGYFVERGLLDREWASTTAFVQSAARAHLRPADFGGTAPMATLEAGDRFEEFARQVRMLPDVQRLVVHGRDNQVQWSDAERGMKPDSAPADVAHALAGHAGARLRPGGGDRVDLYVPITFPGEGRVAGVVEAEIDGSRALAAVRGARRTLWLLALASGVALYAALYGVVWRASRTLRAQHAALSKRADELARSNDELRATQEALLTAERFAAFGEITAAVAHGIGNPLASIRATAQVALLDAPAGPIRDGLRQIVVDTDRLRDRMRALLNFGRPAELRAVPTVLATAVRPIVDQLRPRCLTQGIRVEVRVPDDLPTVELDPARFEEALLCLAGNALDAMPRSGTLTLAARPVEAEGAPPAVELSVEDSGPGIPPALRERALEPFFTTKPGGTGLGLAVARRLLEASGARLRLDSPPAGGTRLTITLPRHEGEPCPRPS
jgi:signal transduction histidine kinase